MPDIAAPSTYRSSRWINDSRFLIYSHNNFSNIRLDSFREQRTSLNSVASVSIGNLELKRKKNDNLEPV